MIISWHGGNCSSTLKLLPDDYDFIGPSCLPLVTVGTCHFANCLSCRQLSFSFFSNWKLVSCRSLSHPRLLSLPLMHCWRLWPNCWHMLCMLEFCSFPIRFSFVYLFMQHCCPTKLLPHTLCTDSTHTRPHTYTHAHTLTHTHTHTHLTTSFTGCHWHIQLAEKCLSADNVSYEWYMHASRAYWVVSNLFSIYQQLLLSCSAAIESRLLKLLWLSRFKCKIRNPLGKLPAAAPVSLSLSQFHHNFWTAFQMIL